MKVNETGCGCRTLAARCPNERGERGSVTPWCDRRCRRMRHRCVPQRLFKTCRHQGLRLETWRSSPARCGAALRAGADDAIVVFLINFSCEAVNSRFVPRYSPSDSGPPRPDHVCQGVRSHCEVSGMAGRFRIRSGVNCASRQHHGSRSINAIPASGLASGLACPSSVTIVTSA